MRSASGAAAVGGSDGCGAPSSRPSSCDTAAPWSSSRARSSGPAEADCPSAYGALHGRAGGAFTEGELHVTDIAANGDRVVAHFDDSGRHSGKCRGVAPNGQRRMAHVVAVYRMAQGRIAEGWGTLSWD